MIRILLLFCFTISSFALGDTFGLDSNLVGEHQAKNRIWAKVKTRQGLLSCQLWKKACAEESKCASCKVDYLTGEDRRKRQLKYDQNMKVWRDFNGKPYDTQVENKKYNVRVVTKFDKTAKEKWGVVPGIWVVDPQGNFYASVEQAPGKFHHSSFLAGGLVEGAGQIVFEDGVITHINNASGHYKPDRASFLELIETLHVPKTAQIEFSSDSQLSESPTKLRTSSPGDAEEGKAQEGVIENYDLIDSYRIWEG